MKTITIFLSALVLSVNALAFENVEKSNIDSYGQKSSRLDVALNQASLATDLLAQSVANGETKTQATINKQDELFIQVCVYLIIILIYSAYFLIVNDIKKTP